MILLPPLAPCPLPHRQPERFAALMDLYESNYINIRRLIPQIPKYPAHLVSQIPEGLDLHLQLLERSRYTSEVNLTYRFTQGPINTLEPDLRIRIYHDARLAEVLTAQLRQLPAFDAESLASHPTATSHLYRRWKINRFLFKWLNYCLRQGHRFPALGNS